MMVDVNINKFAWVSNELKYDLSSYDLTTLFYAYDGGGYKIVLQSMQRSGWDRKDYMVAISFYKSIAYMHNLEDFEKNLDKYLNLITIKNIIE